MPKEVECVICKNTVSKRKSLAFKDGRACRDHKEVIDHVKKQVKESDMKAIDEKMNLICAVSMVRVQHSIRGIPVSILLHKIRQAKGRDFYLKVVDELDKHGHKLTAGELMTSLLMYGRLTGKKLTGG